VSEVKWSIYFCPNMDPDIRAGIFFPELNIMTKVMYHKYLVIPALVGADGYDSFLYLLERVIKRLEGWKEESLSMGVRKFYLRLSYSL
jgi:hypothetical protein